MKNNNLSQPNSLNTYSAQSVGPPTISLNEAKARAASWRALVSNIQAQPDPARVSPAAPAVAIPPQLVFRAINIKMSDIDWLRAQHPAANSIRLYLSIPVEGYNLQICGMLVPVDAQNKDMLTTENPGASNEAMLGDPLNSTIYDFTQPCPTLCDTGSILFDNNNDAEPYLNNKK